jgi:pimeloyl-ACP methyl ester carboxylesterase
VATFVLVPGAGGEAAYWSRVVPLLERQGHTAVPVDIAEDDPALGLPEYAATVEAAIGGRGDDVVLVAQSLGGFTAPMVARSTPLRMIVLLNAMIPLPGATPGDWWEATGSGPARQAADEAAGRDPEFDMERHFLHDVPDEIKAELLAGPGREPSDTPFGQACDFDSWPDIPVRVLVGRDDRFFPADFQRRVAKERLGIAADEITGGHLVALSNPSGVAERLIDYVGAPR